MKSILHIPQNPAGVASSLCAEENKRGFKSDCIILYQNYINYPATKVLHKKIPRGPMYWIEKFLDIPTIYKFSRKYDVINIHGMSTILDAPSTFEMLDLPILAKRAKIITTFHGCELRDKFQHQKISKYMCCSKPECKAFFCENPWLQKKRLKLLLKYSKQSFVTTPDLLQYLPEGSEYIPVTLPNWDYLSNIIQKKNQNKPLRIAHAPTNTIVKSTHDIITAIKEINQKCPRAIELDLIKGVSNSECISRLIHADLIVDQISVGWYGVLALEAMKTGAAVAAYIEPMFYDSIDKKMGEDCRKTIININQDNIKETLLYYIENPEELLIKQKNSINYVNRWHNPKVAADIITKYY